MIGVGTADRRVLRETGADRAAQSVALSHVSVELGHLYMEDFAKGYDALRAHFERVAPLVGPLATDAARLSRGKRPRISTCFLIDDYFTSFGTPEQVVVDLQKAAAEAGLTIDYIVRESACANMAGLDLARLVADRLVVDPPRHTTGTRPPVAETGWLCNGERTPGAGTAPAMTGLSSWRAPAENGARNHSIFIDIELWDEQDGQRRWACPFLSAVWQLLRLGLVRHRGRDILAPTPVDEWLQRGASDRWADMPPVVQANPQADPFSAYRTLSLLSSRYQHIETAVRVILGQVAVEQAVLRQVTERGRAETASLPDGILGRIGYVFLSD